MPKTFIRDIDKGMNELRKRVKDGNARVKIGVQGDDALKGKKLSGGGQTEEINIVSVATFHEFGAEGNGVNIPERSFLRATIDANRSKYQSMLTKGMTDVVDMKLTQEQALNFIGTKVQADVVRRINEGINPPNSPRTVRAKGSSTPLIDTGQLKQSITYIVEAPTTAKAKK